VGIVPAALLDSSSEVIMGILVLCADRVYSMLPHRGARANEERQCIDSRDRSSGHGICSLSRETSIDFPPLPRQSQLHRELLASRLSLTQFVESEAVSRESGNDSLMSRNAVAEEKLTAGLLSPRRNFARANRRISHTNQPPAHPYPSRRTWSACSRWESAFAAAFSSL